MSKRLIAPQTQNPLHTLRAGSILLAGNPPNCPKPSLQRLTCPFKDRSRSHRRLVVASRASVQTRSVLPRTPVSTPWTSVAVWPSQLRQISPACILARELRLQFPQCFRVFRHAATLHIAERQSRRYPSLINVFPIQPLKFCRPEPRKETNSEILNQIWFV